VRLGRRAPITRGCGFAQLPLAPRSRVVSGDKRGRAVVAAREFALWRPGINRGEQVGIVGGRDLRDLVHKDDSSLPCRAGVNGVWRDPPR